MQQFNKVKVTWTLGILTVFFFYEQQNSFKEATD